MISFSIELKKMHDDTQLWYWKFYLHLGIYWPNRNGKWFVHTPRVPSMGLITSVISCVGKRKWAFVQWYNKSIPKCRYINRTCYQWLVFVVATYRPLWYIQIDFGSVNALASLHTSLHKNRVIPQQSREAKYVWVICFFLFFWLPSNRSSYMSHQKANDKLLLYW